MNTATTSRIYRVLGTTDEVTECEHCGRTELKGTIRLGILDADGTVEDVTHFGAVCGARAAGWTTPEIRKAATAADRAARKAALIVTEHPGDEFCDWMNRCYGFAAATLDVLNGSFTKRHTGKTAPELVAAFNAR